MKRILFLLLLISGIAEAQIVNIPDANFKAALLSANATNGIAQGSSGPMAVDANGDGEIQVSEALLVTSLQFQDKSIADFSGIENFSNLSYFGSYRNRVNDFHLNGLQLLRTINISGNTSSNAVFTFLNLPRLESFTFTYSTTTSLTLINLTSLERVSCEYNDDLSMINLEGLTSLEEVNSYACILANLSITDSPMLKKLDLRNNNLTSISTPNFPNLKVLNVTNNQITSSTGIVNINNIEEIGIGGNPIFNLVLPTSLPRLKYLNCGQNGLSTINLTGYPVLRSLIAYSNNLTDIDFSNNPLINDLQIPNNQMSNLNVNTLSLLRSVDCSNNNFSELDFSHNPLLGSLTYSNNSNLTYINLKSGLINEIRYSTDIYRGLPNLKHICIDEGDTFSYPLLTAVPTVPISSYCSFTPGGNYNTITGKTIFDSNNNGCDAQDAPRPFMKMKINDGTSNGFVFTNANADYTFYTGAGNFTINPELENATFFNSNPANAVVNFPEANNSVSTNNFCLSANGIRRDLEIIIAPLVPARPGFDAVYRILYKNKGNQTVQGHVNFRYNSNVLDLVSASVPPQADMTGPGFMYWLIPNIRPFENGYVDVVFNVNAPTETPAVNIGDVLAFRVFVDVTTDENWTDNEFILNQTVVGSYDPNDITCLQGDSVPASEIGNYLHYMIRFENTGNYHAENVVVKEVIDLAKYDIESLQVLGTSHAVDARIRGNIAEFIFQSINLDSGGHGNVLLKLKSKSTLVTGDQVSKKASIYFDYNFPIVTNDANTVFQSLSIGEHHLDNSIKMYPNPANEFVSVKASGFIKSVEFYDVQGRILQTNLVNERETKLDLSKYASGIYYLKIKTDKGYKIEKLVKK